MSREILKVFCQHKKNHRVGTVKADADGLFIEYIAEVWHPTGIIFGAPHVERLPDAEVSTLDGYCTSCKAPVSLSVVALRKAALGGLREVHATSGIEIDKQWADSDRPAMYPSDIKWKRHDPRQHRD